MARVTLSQGDKIPNVVRKDGSTLRRCATWACMPTTQAFCGAFQPWRKAPWSALNRWSNCVCCGMASASRCMSLHRPRAMAWTRPKTWSGCGNCSRHPRAEPLLSPPLLLACAWFAPAQIGPGPGQEPTEADNPAWYSRPRHEYQPPRVVHGFRGDS